LSKKHAFAKLSAIGKALVGHKKNPRGRMWPAGPGTLESVE